MKRVLYLCLGTLCVGLGILGAMVPVMPTTVFLIMAAYFYARSSERLYGRLLSHPTVGPVIKNWETHKTMPRRARIIALTMTTLGASGAMFLPMPWFVKALLLLAAVVMIVILLNIQTEEERLAMLIASNTAKSPSSVASSPALPKTQPPESAP